MPSSSARFRRSSRPTAFQAVSDAGIPILNTLTIPAGPGDPKKVGYLTPNFIGFQAINTDYIIANSNAAANVLYVKATDTPATKIWADAGALAEYKKRCPKCKVTVVETSTGQLSKLPSLISSALIKNPNITWIQAEFDSLVQPIVTGLQSSPRRSQIKIVSMDGTLPVLQLVKAKRSVVADYGYNLNAFGWYAADQALRMMAGQSSLQNVQFPYTRLFQAGNTSRINLTPRGAEHRRVVRLDGLPGGLQEALGRRLTRAISTTLTAGAIRRRPSGCSGQLGLEVRGCAARAANQRGNAG